MASSAGSAHASGEFDEKPRHNNSVDVLDKESHSASNASALPAQTRAVTGWKWVLVCVGLYCAIFLYGLDNTVAADIQSAVVDTYGEIGQLAWIGTDFRWGLLQLS